MTERESVAMWESWKYRKRVPSFVWAQVKFWPTRAQAEHVADKRGRGAVAVELPSGFAVWVNHQRYMERNEC